MGIMELTQKIERLAADTGFVYHIASRYYRDVIRNEISLAGITGHDRILCIGGGFCPFSAILLRQITGAGVTVIDNDSACIPKARQVIERLGLDIHLQCRDGCCAELSLTEYSVVHFAMQVTPIGRVFAEVERKAAQGTKLLVRRPKECLSMLYCKQAVPLPSHCAVHGRAGNIGRTYLYIKQGAPA